MTRQEEIRWKKEHVCEEVIIYSADGKEEIALVCKEENADLIASAPEMFETLEMCRRLLKDSNNYWCKTPATCIAIVEDVIARAKGGAKIALFLIAILSGTVHADEMKLVRLSNHFSLNEFNQKSDPLPVEKIKVSEKLVDRLELLRKMIGGQPVFITSGYRSHDYNKRVGGVEHSQHLHGKAADISVTGMSPEKLALFAKRAGFSYIKIYPKHVHVDVR